MYFRDQNYKEVVSLVLLKEVLYFSTYQIVIGNSTGQANLKRTLKTKLQLTNTKTIAIKKLLTIFSLFLSVLFTSCKQSNTVSELGKNIRSILQDGNGNYWFGSDSEGVYRYDGKTLTQFTFKDGLPDNQVKTIQEDKSGNIWFVTGGGICHYDGKSFITFTDTKEKRDSLTSVNGRQNTCEEICFEAGAGAYCYNGNSFSYLHLPKIALDTSYSNHPYTVYCSYKDKRGKLWFGTQNLGVCRYDGNSFTWFTEKGLSGPVVRALFEDKNGNLWFGTNGGGLFRYDGKSLTNFTEESRVNNYEYEKNLNDSVKPGNLARVWTINEDNNENLWIGTIDLGVWRYDGRNLTHYTTKNGLTSNVINTIYKDKKGELWFGTGTDVCKFNGKSFGKFSIRQML